MYSHTSTPVFVIPLFSNLIQPPGMMLRPAVFSLTVFIAEDIPQSEFLTLLINCCYKRSLQ